MRSRRRHIAVLLVAALLAVLGSLPLARPAAAVPVTNACFTAATATYSEVPIDMVGTAAPDPVTTGATLTLSNTSVTATFGAALFLAGYRLFILQAGDNNISATVNATILASNTNEASDAPGHCHERRRHDRRPDAREPRQPRRERAAAHREPPARGLDVDADGRRRRVQPGRVQRRRAGRCTPDHARTVCPLRGAHRMHRRRELHRLHAGDGTALRHRRRHGRADLDVVDDDDNDDDDHDHDDDDIELDVVDHLDDGAAAATTYRRAESP